jgi:hypothetical protein
MLLGLAAVAPAAQAQEDAPGVGQYVPSVPEKGGKSDTRDNTQNAAEPGADQATADDQTLDQLAGGTPAASSTPSEPKSSDKQKQKKSKKDKKQDDSGDSAESATLPVTPSGDDGDDDGALASFADAVTDWDDPVVPGLVLLVALATLVTSVTVLVSRRRASGPDG